MKRTRKYNAGRKRLQELTHGQYIPQMENDVLYQKLENDHKQIWDHKQGEWMEGNKSMFGDDEPTGVVRIRVMAHPQDVHNAVHYLKGTNFKIVEVSDEYPNRRGSGVRVYITAQL